MTKSAVKGNLYAGIVFLIFGMAMVYGAMNFAKSQIMEVGPEFFPILIGSVMAGLSVILILTSAIQLRSVKPVKTVKPDQNATQTERKGAVKHVMVILGLLTLYVLLYIPLGFRISSMMFLMAKMCYLAENLNLRKIIVLAIISVSVPFIVHHIFLRFLHFMLPLGIFNI